MSAGRYKKMLEYNGTIMDASGWSNALGISVRTLYYRLQHNYPMDKVFTTKNLSGRPKGAKNKKHRQEVQS